MMSGFEQFLGQDDPSTPRLGAIQVERLRRLLAGRTHVLRWDGSNSVSAPNAAVIVCEAAHAARVQTLIDDLDENSIVILPFGENPAFDHLKSRLHAHGSIGAQGHEAPHHIWWGGLRPPAVKTGMYRREDTLFISSFRAATAAEQDAGNLARDFGRFRLDHAVEAVSPDITLASQATAKVDFIIRQWTKSCRPVFWIDPQSTLGAHPLLPQATGCDFAACRDANGAILPDALFFHQTEAARELLDIWQRLTTSHPNLPESFLLDQAWTLIASQRQMETCWLPETYRRADEALTRDSAVIARKSIAPDDNPLAPYAAPLQSGRRFGRHQAPEAHLIMKGAAGGTRGPITVVIRDVLGAAAADVGQAVEATTSAFSANSGGFSQMEIVLCGWNEDVDSVLQIEDYSWVLMTDASERLNEQSFLRLSAPPQKKKSHLRRSPRTAWNADKADAPQVLDLVDASLGARLKRSGRYRDSFLMRPAHAV